nr:Chain B, Protein AMBP [Homo sapiens]
QEEEGAGGGQGG